MKKNSAIFLGITGLLVFADSMSYAATKKIASQSYVDSRESEILNEVQNTYETKENVSAISQKITDLGNQISDPTDGLSAKIDKVAGDLSTTQGTVATISGDLENKEDVGNKATDIGIDNQNSSTAYPSVGAVVNWTNKRIQDLEDSGLEVNPDNIGDGSIEEIKLDPDLRAKIDGKEDAINKVTTIRDSVAATDIAYPSEKAVATALEGKADTADLSDLATKTELENYATTADLENYATTTDLENYATTESLATVATTGSYNDLSDKPVIPEGVVVDEAITAQGTNPVQGKAVYEALAGKQAVGDYATNTDLSDVRSTAESAQSDATSALSAAAEAKTLAGTKVTANEDIVAGTGTKITYDAKGLVTGSANLEVADLPDAIPTTKISGLATVATTGSYNDLSDKPVIPEGVVVDEAITAQGTNPVQGKAVYEALAGKQPVGDYATTDELSAYATTEDIAKMENVDNKAASITLENQSSVTAYPSVGAIVQWTNDKILELSEEGLPVSPDNIGAGSITEDKLDVAVVNKIDSKEDKTNKVSQIDDTNKTDETKYVSVKAVADYVIPKPSKDCTAQSGLCVLSATTDGGFAWVNVTAPAGEN